MSKKFVNFFLDSGAHSFYMKAMIKKEKISCVEFDAYFNDYMDYLTLNSNYVNTYVNLDVINDPEASFKNYLIMREKGFNPIAVVHPGEDPVWVKKYIDIGCTYLGLGGLGQFFTASKYIQWADKVWLDYLTDFNGMPLVKVHGFAMTSVKLMCRYPWYSVDSTSWLLASAFGKVFVPKMKKSKYVYDKSSLIICVSNKSPFINKDGRHIINFALEERKLIENYFEYNGFVLGKSRFFKKSESYKLKENESWFSKTNKDGIREVEKIIESGLCNDRRKRSQLNALYFMALEKNMLKWPWAFRLKRAKGFDL